MIAFITALVLFCTTYVPVQPPAAAVGAAVHYSPGLMAHVYRVREWQGLVPRGYVGDMAAAIECSDIGRIEWVSYRNPRTGQYSPARRTLIVDCSQNRDKWRHYQERLYIEASWETAQETGWASEGRTQVRVWR